MNTSKRPHADASEQYVLFVSGTMFEIQRLSRNQIYQAKQS